jgi:hypothetical protein
LATVRYGILQNLSVEAGLGFWSAKLSARWNFANTESWAFSIQPSYLFQYNDYLHYGSSTESAAMLLMAAAASAQLNNDNHIHFSLSGGRFNQNRHITETVYHVSSATPNLVFREYQEDNSAYGIRTAAEFEHRFNYRHGISFWQNVQLLRYKEDTTYSGTEPETFEYNETAPTTGIAYHYNRETYWLMIGLELDLARVLRSERPSTYERFNAVTSSPIYGSINLATGWRF